MTKKENGSLEKNAEEMNLAETKTQTESGGSHLENILLKREMRMN